MNLEDYAEIFEPFDELVEIEILGAKYKVPENNSLLRGFQFLSMENISLGNFCWNGECGNCSVRLEKNGREKDVLACRVQAENGLKIVRMSGEIVLTKNGKRKVENFTQK